MAFKLKEAELPFPSLSPSLSPTRWWSKDTVAIVTGANRGIGFAVVKWLAKMGVSVVLTARDLKRGSMAVEALRSQGLVSVHFFCLDVTDPASINTFASWFALHFPALDILVNNAGVSFNEIHENSVEHAETVIKTNFYGPKMLTEALLPMFRRSSHSSRILNITSRLGSLNKVRNGVIKEMLEKEDLREEEIEGMVSRFLEDVKSGRWESQGWPELWTDYAVSKLALNAYTAFLAKRYRGRGLSVNCFCPGFTQTSMTGGKGTHSADDAAEFGANLALLPPQHLPTGNFFLMGSTTTSSINNNNVISIINSKL